MPRVANPLPATSLPDGQGIRLADDPFAPQYSIRMPSLMEAIERNRILAGLPSEERRMVEQQAEVTCVHLGDVLDRAGEPVGYLCFPIDAAISMMDMKDRAHTLDVALVGAEGCTGAWVVQGSETSPSLNMVEIGGSIVRLAAAAIDKMLPKLPYLNAVLSRYNLLLMRHIVISVGCSQFHSAEQRIARWLLAHKHRAGLSDFPFTSEFLSAQVGVDTETTRRVLDELQQRGLVRKSARAISLLDAERLAGESCACFQLTKDATDGYIEALAHLSRTYSAPHRRYLSLVRFKKSANSLACVSVSARMSSKS